MNTRKTTALFLSILLSVCIFASCKNTKATDNSTDSEPVTYNYVFRDLPEAKYLSPATAFAGGDGTEEDPYKISSAAELVYLKDLLKSNDRYDYNKAHYILTADITINEGDASNWAKTPPEYNWGPIDGFDGTFDGAGHTISGLYLNADFNDETKADHTGDNYGLFRVLGSDAKLQDFNLTDSYLCVSGYKSCVGAVAGNAGSAELKNIHSDAIAEGYDVTCGGIAGRAGNFDNCSFSGTVRLLKEGSSSQAGGIAGAMNSGAKISNCEFSGTIESPAVNAADIGGIAGSADGLIESCVNNGMITADMGTPVEKGHEQSSGTNCGGIVGAAYVSSIGGEKDGSKGIEIVNCTNNGKISASCYAGGIAGRTNNDASDYTITISDCTNNAVLTSADKTAGICPNVRNSGRALNVVNCVNNAALTGECSGIIRELQAINGTLTVSGCKNTADLNASGICGGVIGVAYCTMDREAHLTVENCRNDGNLTAKEHIGGIAAYFNNAGNTTRDADVVKVQNCVNTGDLTTESYNSFAGGIVGGFGIKDSQSEISGCVNIGDITFLDTLENAVANESSDGKFELARMAGGIIGRIGDTLYLTTQADKQATIESGKCNIQISDCYSCGSFKLPSEDSHTYNDGKIEIVNYCGGIVGTIDMDEGYYTNIENCGYTNAARGIGNDKLADAGTMVAENVIISKIS